MTNEHDEALVNAVEQATVLHQAERAIAMLRTAVDRRDAGPFGEIAIELRDVADSLDRWGRS